MSRVAYSLPLGVALLAAIVGGACRDDPGPSASSSVASTTPPATGAANVEAAAKRLCESGDNRGCERLLEMYLTGKGVPQSDTKAAELNRSLCEGGRRSFCPSFAMALQEGRGVTQDKPRARALFVHTCDADPVACSEYGSLYANGLGVARDLELARWRLALACRHGDRRACEDLERF